MRKKTKERLAKIDALLEELRQYQLAHSRSFGAIRLHNDLYTKDEEQDTALGLISDRLDATAALVQKRIERVRSELLGMILSHDEEVVLNDWAADGGRLHVKRLDVFRGRTPGGQKIHTVRRANEAMTEYHVEGFAEPDQK